MEENKVVATEEQQQQKQERKEKKENNNNKDKKDRKPKEKRESPYDWDKTKVTLETVIAALPKQKERLNKPDEAHMEKKREVIQKKIDELYEKKRHFIENMILKNKENKTEKNKGQTSLRDTLKEKQAIRKELEEKFDVVKKDFEDKKSKIEAIFQETQKIRQKMKFCVAKPELEEMIAERQDELNNGTLTVQQEKKLIQEIENLNRSLPLAQKLFPLEEQIKTLNEEKRIIGKTMFTQLNELKQAREEVKEIHEDLDNLRSMTEKSKESIEPIIQQKKEEIADEVQKLRDEKNKIFTEYKTAVRAFNDQQELIRHIEWQRRIQEKLKREERKKQREEEKAARQKAWEEAQANKEVENPYLKDIALCEQLLAFCKNQQLQNQASNSTEQTTQSKEVDLNSGDWKKENVTQLKTKKQENVDDFLMGQKKTKGKKKYVKQEEQNKPAPINLSYQDLNDFATIKVSHPKDVSELQKTIEALEEKKTYFEGLPIPEQAPATEEEQQEEQVKKPKKKVVQIDNEEDYPEL